MKNGKNGSINKPGSVSTNRHICSKKYESNNVSVRSETHIFIHLSILWIPKSQHFKHNRSITHHENEERYEGMAIVVSPVYPVRRVIPNLKAVKRSNVQKGDLMDRSIFLEKKIFLKLTYLLKKNICPSTTSLPMVLDF